MFLPLVPEYCEIQRMVFLAAAIPEPGKSLRQRFQIDARMFNPQWLGQDPTRNPEVAKEFLFHDCEPAVADWALTTMRLMYVREAMVEQCPLRRWPQVPSIYILPTEDRTINPQWWHLEALRLLRAAPIELPGGHCPHVSRPASLAEVLSVLAL
jgi:pimeloyl-ACP methyl ester carboxylesterase